MTVDPDTQLVSVYVNRSKGDPANSCRLFRVLTGRECTFDIDSMVSRWDGPRAACEVDIFVSVPLLFVTGCCYQINVMVFFVAVWLNTTKPKWVPSHVHLSKVRGKNQT